jgi:hypothetical protein
VAVYAQSPTPPTPAAGQPQGGPGHPDGSGDASHPFAQAELDAAAKALGITSTDLSAQLKAGKTLQDIATAQGVDINVVRQAMDAARPPMLGPTELDAAAKALGMTSADLSAQLQSGKTLQDLATSKGATLQVVQDAINAARQADMTARVKQAVTNGTMTQDKADWLLQGIAKGYLNGPDGFGFGFGGRGFGHGGPGGPNLGQPAPQATPSTTP